MLFVYILKCKDGFYYVGITNDLCRRVDEHNQGLDKKCFTFSRRPVELLWSQAYSDYMQCIRVEKQLKGWSRKKKEALIEGDMDRLQELAKSR